MDKTALNMFYLNWKKKPQELQMICDGLTFIRKKHIPSEVNLIIN